MKPDFEDSSGVLHDHDALNLVNFAHMIVYFQTNLTKDCLIWQNFVFWPTSYPDISAISAHYETLAETSSDVTLNATSFWCDQAQLY